MKIGIVGVGFVGGATNHVISKYFETVPYDKFKKQYKGNKDNLKNCEILFVAVPSPMKESGENDLSYIYEAMDQLNRLDFEIKPLVVIRSTVVPGTTMSLSKKYPEFDFAFNPEFLREKYAIEDFESTNRVVFGINSDKNFEKLKDIYKKFVPDAVFFKTDFNTAETIKYAANCMLATQIIAANELYKISEIANANYNEILKVLALDKRIGTNLSAPGPDGDFGFGGKCFPKDINALISYAENKNYSADLFKEVWRSNKKFRKNKDWLNIAGAVSENKDFAKI